MLLLAWACQTALGLPPPTSEGALQAVSSESCKHNCKAQRSVVVLKLPRTGSTWLVHALNSTGLWCQVVDEATNRVFDDKIAAHHGMTATKKCTDAGATVEAALTCPRHPNMRGGLSINPLKFSSVATPSWLQQGPGQDRLARGRYARALKGIDWAPGYIGYNDTWNTSVWVRDAPTDRDTSTMAAAREAAKGGEMTCRSQEVRSMAKADAPPRLLTLLRSNTVQQAASMVRAEALNHKLVNCDGWHPERCHDKTDRRTLKQKLWVSPADLLDKAEVLENAAATVRRVAGEIAQELGTSLHHTTYEELAAAGGSEGMALPRNVEAYLGMEHGAYEIHVDTDGSTHTAAHPPWSDGPRLAADIKNFPKVQVYFETHASPLQLKMLME